MRVTHIYAASEDTQVLELPLLSFGVQAGFPSPAQDYVQSMLDLNAYVVKNREATFFLRVEGDSMQDARVFNNDIVVVDKSLTPLNGSLVIASLEGDLVLRKFCKVGKRVFLVWNDVELEITSTPLETVEIWGTVTFVIHDMRQP